MLLYVAWTQKLPSGRYQGLYRDRAGKTKSVGTFTLKRQAQAKANDAEAAARTAPVIEGIERSAGMPTLTEWLPNWRRTRRKAEDYTKAQDEARLANHIEPRFGDVKLDAIGPADVQAWVNELTNSGMAASTVQKTKSVLSSIMGTAYVAEVITRNPCHGIKMPKIPPAPDRYLDESERAKLLDVLDGADADLFVFLIGTGLRWGELMALHWDSVDLRAKTISVERAFVPRKYRYFKPPKGYEIRTIPVAGDVIDVLRSLPMDAEVPDLEYRDVAQPTKGLVFPNAVGLPMADAAFGSTLKAAAKVTKIRHVRPHDLRHTYGSRLVQAGVDIYQVKALMGHSSVETTMRYARLGESGWDAVRSALS